MKRFLLLVALSLGSIAQLGSQTISQIIVNSDDHTTLAEALEVAGLASTFNSPGSYTFFAPTDEAFAALPSGVLESLLANPEQLAQVLRYHVLGFSLFSASFSNGLVLNTLNGQQVSFTVNSQGIFVNNALITVQNIQATNGYVHVINAVLIPEIEEPQLPSIAEIVIESEVHTRLESFLESADLLSTLDGNGTFTLFAPTDEAFEALPVETINALLANPSLLNSILLYHVAGQVYESSELTNGQSIATLNGANVTVIIDGSNIFINGSRIIVSDIEANNGIVHVLNAVLVPSTPPVDPNSCFATEIFSFAQKKQNDGSNVAEIYSNALNALGEPQNVNDENTTENVGFVSLGFGGEIILSFGGAINNGEGDDIMVYEATPNIASRNCTRWPEKIDVFASQDNCNWVYLGRGCQDASFDLGSLSWAQFIRIKDVSNPSGGLFVNLIGNGYDLDGVACLNGTVENPVPDNLLIGFAAEVVSFNQGNMRNGNPVALSRSNPESALGVPQSTNAVNFVSLGFGGKIVVKFDYVVFDEEGFDLQIVETSFGNPSCNQYPERANVEGSINGTEWVDLNVSACQDVMVDINLIGALQYLRITDRSNSSQFSGTADGYDLDGIVVSNGCASFENISQKIEDNISTPDEILSVNAYPNPFTDILNIALTSAENDENAHIQIRNYLGQIVYSEKLSLEPGKDVIHPVSLVNNERGIYLVSVSTNSSTENFKLIKN
jgi:uncharacterized surface protein with fasciclin (FAS1) repeats